MREISVLLVVLFLLCVAPYANSASQELLNDGYVIKGAGGKLVGPDVNDVWQFEFGSDVNDINDVKVVVPAGTRMGLLPSTTLAKIIVDSNDHPDRDYRLWARVTEYENKNYMFPMYFLRIVKEKESDAEDPNDVDVEEGETPQTSEQQEPAVNEPNDILEIPQEVLDMLEARRPETMGKGDRAVGAVNIAASKLRDTDSVLIDRIGRLAMGENGGLEFVPDAFGRKVSSQNDRFEILPCETLEWARREVSIVPESVKFKVSGITTKYEGKKYLLLHKATRLYSHGNFGR